MRKHFAFEKSCQHELKEDIKIRQPVNFQPYSVYLKSSDYNGHRKLEGFVSEKQLLPPSHA